MKFSLRSLLLFVLVVAISVVGVQWYLSYQQWRSEFHLNPITVRLRGSQSNEITHPPATEFVIDTDADAASHWLNLSVGYFNHAGVSRGDGWGWLARPKITATETEFRYELYDSEFPDSLPNMSLPRINTTITHSQLEPRLSKLVMTTVLIDSNGQELDTVTKSITITDSPRQAKNGG